MTSMKSSDHSTRKHAKNSPSKLASLNACPSYKSDNSAPPHPVTLEGTAMHEALDDGDFSRLDEDQIEHVQMCQDYVEATLGIDLSKIWEKDGNSHRYDNGVHVFLEELLKTHEPNTFGFSDLMAIDTKRHVGHVMDYKFGYWPVEDAETNLQGKAYALGAFNAAHPLAGVVVDEVTVHFLCPRQGDGGVISTHTFKGLKKGKDMTAIMDEISSINRRVEAGGEYNPGDVCRFCAAKAKCPTFNGGGLSVFRRIGLPVPSDLRINVLNNDPVKLGQAWLVADILADWCEQVKKAALNHSSDVLRGIPGLSYQTREGAIGPVDIASLWDFLDTELGWTFEEFLAHCKPSVPGICKAEGQKAERGQKKTTEDALRETLLANGLAKKGPPVAFLKKGKDWKEKLLEAKPNKLNK